MMNRREALISMSAAVLSKARPLNALVRPLQSAAADTQEPASVSHAKDNVQMDERLRKDLARLVPREYSEEGIPVFLACEDLVGSKNSRETSVQLTSLNAVLADEMRQNAEAWQRIRPDASESDVAKLIEVLADRDFTKGGTESEAANSAPTFADRAATLAELFATHPVIRAVNFHNTPRAKAEYFERQLAQYSRSFSSVNADELDEYLTTGKWHKSKPGLIVSVFEGYRNSFDVLAPLIEKYGFVGWFFMITGFLNTPVPDQGLYADHHDIDMMTHEYSDGRYALTWEELRQLDKKHVIASHTRSHTLLSQLPPDVQRQEVIGAQEDFKRNLGHPVRAFVSLTGPTYGESPAIDRLIDAAGYDTVFSNFRIQRIRPKK